VFDHRNFALLGLYPGLVSTRSVANLGHFEVEVIIEPVTGGGGGWAPATPITKYNVRIIVRTKTKVWDYKTTVNTTMARVIARVIGKKLEEPTVTMTGIKIKETSQR
jgi:hypothetical protein